MERRELIKTLGLGASSVAIAGCSGKNSLEKVNDKTDSKQGISIKTSRKEARKKAAGKFRRMIMNNDGHDFHRQYGTRPEWAITAENMLSQRTLGLLNTHVDSIFYCTGVFNSYTHKSDISAQRLDNGTTDGHLYTDLISQGRDSLEIMTDFCHQQSMEMFWSIRMNDNHDATREDYTSLEWKLAHPDCLFGQKGDKLKHGKWSQLDYEKDEVREKFFRIIEDVATRYDIDGIELDFFRHLIFFKAMSRGEELRDEHREMMTSFLRRIRQMTEEVAARRERPFLLAARLPDSVDFAHAAGLDMETWLAEDLLDIMVGTSYFKLEPWENFAVLGQKYKVPVYACLETGRVNMGTQQGNRSTEKCFRGEALAAWHAGINGIYTFNMFDPHSQLFRELGDPTLLESLERIDQVNYAGEKGYSDPGSWVEGGRKYIRRL